MQILASSVKIKEVIPSYKPEAPNDIIFVAFCESDEQIQISPFVNKIDIKFQCIGKQSDETKSICAEDQRFSENDKEEKIKLTDILQKTSSHFMRKHSNLNIITASPSKSRGFAIGEHCVDHEPCIVFYVRLKGYIPLNDDEFPSAIGHYKTDVREDAFLLYNDPEPYLQRLKIGCSIFGNGNMGTLGGFVSLSNGTIGCVTSAHVLLHDDALFRIKQTKTNILDTSATLKVYQPAPTADMTPFGEVTSVVYKTGGESKVGVEACLITITDPKRYPDNGRFPKVTEGYTETDQLQFMSGCIFHALPAEIAQYTFYKYGATTGLTRGAFVLQAGAVREDSMSVRENCELHNQIVICSVGSTPFAKPGDSGALVLAANDNNLRDLKAIGILTGGNANLTQFYVTPIWEVLNALELPLQLTNFNIHSPIETEDGTENTEKTSLQSEIDILKRNVNVLEKKYEDVSENVRLLNENVGNLNQNMEKLNENLKKKESTINASINAAVDQTSENFKSFLRAHFNNK